jgi:hypothetical protein
MTQMVDGKADGERVTSLISYVHVVLESCGLHFVRLLVMHNLKLMHGSKRLRLSGERA